MTFQSSLIKCCRFHLGQSWWRKIQDLGLSREYKYKKNAFGRRLTNRGSVYVIAFKSYRLSLEIDLDLEIYLDLDPMTLIHELNLDIMKI